MYRHYDTDTAYAIITDCMHAGAYSVRRCLQDRHDSSVTLSHRCKDVGGTSPAAQAMSLTLSHAL